jgi:fatty-acyl-CoA synthase
VEGVRRGNVIAFGVQPHGEDRERVVVAAEVRQLPEDPAEQEKLRGEICAAVLAALSLRVDVVLLLPPGALPKTSSGKLQRSKAAELFVGGELGKGTQQAGALGLIKHLAASRWNFIKASLGSRGG